MESRARDTATVVQSGWPREREVGRERQRGGRCGVLGVIVDFVVIGFGLGAIVLLLGLAVRDLAPRLSHQSGSAMPEQDDATTSHSHHFALAKDAPAVWGRACQALGQTIMIGGGVVVLATVIGIVGQLADENGAQLVLAAALLAFGAIVLHAGKLGNSIYGADRRVRLRSSAAPVAAPMLDGEVAAQVTDEASLSVASPEDEPAQRPANGADPDGSPTSAPPLPDLQALLGDRDGADHRRRDEIVTLEQFLGLAPDAPAPESVEDAPSVNGSSPSAEAVEHDGASDEAAAASAPDHSQAERSETIPTDATTEDDDVDVGADEASSEPQSSASDDAETAETEEQAEALEHPRDANRDASTEVSSPSHEPVPQTS